MFVTLIGRKMRPLSLSDIFKLEYDNQGIGEYRWIHPKLIQGYIPEQVRAMAVQRALNSNAEENTTDTDFEETPDTLITDYLCKCLDERTAHIKNAIPIPSELDVSPTQYIDALLYLITELGSSYACYILGSTQYHDDTFLSSEYAVPILARLKSALQESRDTRTTNLIRYVTLEIFHMGYPWDATSPRFHDVLNDDDKAFLNGLLQATPGP